MKLRKQNLIVKLMEVGKLSPLEGYRRLKRNFAAMTKTEQTTDYCQVKLDLEEKDEVSFMDKLK